MSKRLEDTKALLTRAVKKLSDKQRLIQDQEQLIKVKEKEKKGNLGGCRKSEREKSKCDSICSPKCCAKHFIISRSEYDAFISAKHKYIRCTK